MISTATAGVWESTGTGWRGVGRRCSSARAVLGDAQRRALTRARARAQGREARGPVHGPAAVGHRGLAIDFRADRATGDALARCALDNMRALSIKYVIWQQRINYGDGWEPMEDRGSPTANHMGHVHISFDARPGGSGVASC